MSHDHSKTVVDMLETRRLDLNTNLNFFSKHYPRSADLKLSAVKTNSSVGMRAMQRLPKCREVAKERTTELCSTACNGFVYL